MIRPLLCQLACLYHHSKMNYKTISVFSEKPPYTNTPIWYSLCPPTLSGSLQTIWKYNAVNHFIIEHSNSDHSPSIPGNFWCRWLSARQNRRPLVFKSKIQWITQRDLPSLTVMALNQKREQLYTKGLGQTLHWLYIHKIATLTISLAKRLD